METVTFICEKKVRLEIGSLATLNSSDIKLSSVKKDIFLKTWRSFCKRWKKNWNSKKKKKNWNSHLFNPPRPIAHAWKLKQATHTSDQPKRLSKKFSRPKKQKKNSLVSNVTLKKSLACKTTSKWCWFLSRHKSEMNPPINLNLAQPGHKLILIGSMCGL
jgi:hypothetical protein